MVAHLDIFIVMSNNLLQSATLERLLSLLDKCTSFVVIGNPYDQGETAAGLVAWHHFFEKRAKKNQLFTENHASVQLLRFLPAIETVRIMPEYINLSGEPAQTAIITLDHPAGTPLPPSVQKIRQDFPSIPVITISHLEPVVKIEDRHYFFHPNASSTSEVLHYIFAAIDETLIKKTLATALLTGMIITTKSFRSASVTPDALALASRLVALGAEREKIIHHLYRTRSLSTLKLWGMALVRLKQYHSGLVTTFVTPEDARKVGAKAQEVQGVADELIANAPEAKAALLLYQAKPNDNIIQAFVHSENTISCLDLAQAFAPVGTAQRAQFSVAYPSLVLAEEAVARELERQLAYFQK